jgi:multicomponent K+:H+ antiporter subunit E
VTALKRLIPAPVLSATLVALWLLLARSTTRGDLLVAVALGLAVPLIMGSLRPATLPIRRPLVIVRFVLQVGYDVLISNFKVARGVVGWRWRKPRARFVIIPLELRDPRGLAALAMVTTVVPGTVWAELASDRTALMLHVWDVDEEDAFIAGYKQRYEKPLREIFE